MALTVMGRSLGRYLVPSTQDMLGIDGSGSTHGGGSGFLSRPAAMRWAVNAALKRRRLVDDVGCLPHRIEQ